MTDNEKLIDAAESMTADEIHQHPMVALDKLRALARELRAAETALPATDDEREARLEYVIDAAVPVDEFPSWRFRYSRRIADAVRAAGFDRTVGPELGAEATHRGTFGHVWPCPLFYVGNWKRIENGYEPERACTNAAACANPEPQGAQQAGL